MELTLLERVVISGNLPETGNMIEMLTRKAIIKKLSFTEEEKPFITIKDGVYHFGHEDASEFEFSEAEVDYLKTWITEKDKKKEITPQLLDVAVKIKDI